MANLTLLDLQNETYQQTGLDGTNVTIQTNVTRWLNYVQQDICARWPWTFLLGRETMVSVPDYNTGLAGVSNGQASIAASGGAVWTSTQADGTYFIQFSTGNDWYQITGFINSSTLTISPVYQYSNNTVTYTIRKFFYELSANADMVMDIRNWNTPIKLIQCDFRTIDLINPLVQSSDAPYGYMMFGVNSSGNMVLQPYPFPKDARLFEVRTRLRPTDMVNATDPPSIPNKYAHLLAFGATAVGFAYKKDFASATAWDEKFEKRLAEMKREYMQAGDYQPVLQSIDSISRSRWIQFPSQYPIVGGA